MSMATRAFIGREQEIAFFSQWLADASGPSVVYIHDALKEIEKRGGIGKTWLLNRYYELAEHHQNVIPIALNFFDVLDRNGVIIAERVVQGLQKRYPQWQAEDFGKMLQDYYKAIQRQRAEDISAFRERLADALVSDLRMLQQQMIESNTYIVLFCDTFELIESNPITAVLRPGQTFPDTYRSNRIRTIIAGRNALDWKHQNWVGRELEVQVRPLSPFSYEEMVEYL